MAAKILSLNYNFSIRRISESDSSSLSSFSCVCPDIDDFGSADFSDAQRAAEPQRTAWRRFVNSHMQATQRLAQLVVSALLLKIVAAQQIILSIELLLCSNLLFVCILPKLRAAMPRLHGPIIDTVLTHLLAALQLFPYRCQQSTSLINFRADGYSRKRNI